MALKTVRLERHDWIGNFYGLWGDMGIFVCTRGLRRLFDVPLDAKVVYLTFYTTPGKDRAAITKLIDTGSTLSAVIEGRSILLLWNFWLMCREILGDHKAVYAGVEYDA